MKKVGIALVSVLLAGSLAAFTACGDGNNTDVGKVNGKFDKEATEAELTAAIESIDAEKAFGDVTADGWTYGLKIESGIAIDASMESFGMKMEYSITSNTDGAVSVSKDKSIPYGFAFAGKVEESAKMKMTMSADKQSESRSAQINAGVYFDNTALYLDVSTKGMKDISGEEDISQKGKIATDDLIEYVMDMIGNIGSDDDTDWDIEGLDLVADEEDEEGDGDVVGIEEPISIAGYLDMLAEMGAKVYVDNSDGLKIKVSVGEVLKAAMAEDESTEIAFEECVLDVYVVFDANGAFKQVSIDMNFEMTMANGMSMTMKGGVKISTSNSVVKLPEGIANDTSYTEIDLSEMPSIPGGSF